MESIINTLENSTYVDSGASIINLKGARGFRLYTKPNIIYQGQRIVPFTTITYGNNFFNLQSQIYLDSVTKYLKIAPVGYSRFITMNISLSTGGLALPDFIYFNIDVLMPDGSVLVVLRLQHTQTGGLAKSNVDCYFNLPPLASDIQIYASPRTGSVYLYELTIEGLVMT